MLTAVESKQAFDSRGPWKLWQAERIATWWNAGTKLDITILSFSPYLLHKCNVWMWNHLLYHTRNLTFLKIISRWKKRTREGRRHGLAHHGLNYSTSWIWVRKQKRLNIDPEWGLGKSRLYFSFVCIAIFLLWRGIFSTQLPTHSSQLSTSCRINDFWMTHLRSFTIIVTKKKKKEPGHYREINFYMSANEIWVSGLLAASIKT